MLCGWEGKRMPDVALAVRHRLQSLSNYGSRLKEGICEHPAYTPHEGLALLGFSADALTASEDVGVGIVECGLHFPCTVRLDGDGPVQLRQAASHGRQRWSSSAA